MPRVQIFTEENRTIIFTDLSHLGLEDSSRVMDEAVRVIAQYPRKSVFSLVNMNEMRFNKVIIAKITDTARRNEPHVIITAVVGLNSMTKLIAKSVIKLTGRNTKIFDSIEEARNWLRSVDFVTSSPEDK